MNMNITGRHTTIIPEIKEFCQKRMKSLEKLAGHPLEADLILSTEKYRHKVEINIKTKRATLNTVKETHDLFSSLDLAFDQIEQRVKKEREKLREKKRRRNRSREEFYPPLEKEEESSKRIVRSGDYFSKPLSVEEAVLELESSHKEILVFRLFDSEKLAVIYRRRDGNYGLVEPE